MCAIRLIVAPKLIPARAHLVVEIAQRGSDAVGIVEAHAASVAASPKASTDDGVLLKISAKTVSVRRSAVATDPLLEVIPYPQRRRA